MSNRERSYPQARYLPAPLPGTEVPRRGLFISRWGALLTRPARAQLPAFTPALLAPGALDRLFHVQHKHWNLYLVGNEPSVARGQAGDEHWLEFEQRLLAHLASQGVRITRNYACLDHPHGKGKHKRDSVFLFPNTGVFYHASQADGIVLGESWLVSDDVDELAAAWRAGARLASVRAPDLAAGELQVEPRMACRDLRSALCEVLADDEYARR